MWTAWAVALAVGVAVGTSYARPVPPEERTERKEEMPARLRGIDVDEKLDTTMPAHLSFLDERGKKVSLGDFFDSERPVIVTLNYSNCPMLCSLQLNGLVEALKQLEWTAGEEFRIVTVSLDPEEQPAQAAKTKQRYLRDYGRAVGEEGWHFLTGSEDSIRAVADAIGFSYGYNEEREEYIHPAAFAVLTPEGRIARYLYGIEYHPETLRLSLVEAAEGKIGSTVDKLILYCFHYDASEGRYAPVAVNIMRLGGGAAAMLLGGFLASYWMAESRRKKQSKPSTESSA